MPALLLLLFALCPLLAHAQEPSPMSFDDFERMEADAAAAPARRAKLRTQIDFAAEEVQGSLASSYDGVRGRLKLAHLHHQLGRETRSEADLERAVALYREVVALLPGEELRDHATFFLGFSLRSLRDPEAIGVLGSVPARFPASPYVPHAWLHLGEAFFGDGEHRVAFDAYREAVQRDFELQDFALYKLAWSQERLGRPGDARRTMARVVQETERPGLADAAFEVLDFWSRRDLGRPADRRSLARSVKPGVVQTAAGDGFCLEQLTTFKEALRQEPLAWEAPRTQLEIVLCLVEVGRLGPATGELRRMEGLYGRGSRWAEHQDRDGRRHGRNLIRIGQNAVNALN